MKAIKDVEVTKEEVMKENPKNQEVNVMNEVEVMKEETQKQEVNVMNEVEAKKEEAKKEEAKKQEVNVMNKVEVMKEEPKKQEVNVMNKVEVKKEEVKSMGDNKKETVTKEQEKEYQNCLKIFEKSTKAWIEIAKAYECLRKLPPVLWMGDDVMKNEKRPNVGKFLKAKFDLSMGRLSQIAGAYEARQQLAQAQVEGYETISCNALYEIFRFLKGKDNEKEMTVKEVYEAVRAVGVVSEKTVKVWLKQFKAKPVKRDGAVFERLSKVIEEARRTSLKVATEELIDALKTQCRDFLDMIEKAENTECDDDGEEKQEETESKTMVNVA